MNFVEIPDMCEHVSYFQISLRMLLLMVSEEELHNKGNCIFHTLSNCPVEVSRCTARIRSVQPMNEHVTSSGAV